MVQRATDRSRRGSRKKPRLSAHAFRFIRVDAVADCAHVYATTVRKRGVTKPVVTPEEAARAIHIDTGRSAIVFGPERSGLETDDVALARAIITVPINPEFASLNLAQAVILCAYEWSKECVTGTADGGGNAPPAPQDELEGMIEQIRGAAAPTRLFPPAQPLRIDAAHHAHHPDQAGLEPSGSAHPARHAERAQPPDRARQ